MFLELSYGLLYAILLPNATSTVPKYLFLVFLYGLDDFGRNIVGQECLNSNKDVSNVAGPVL